MCEACDPADVVLQRTSPIYPSPGGIPPWDPPPNGEALAYEGWAGWVRAHGNFAQRMQLMSYQTEQCMVVFGTTMAQAARNAAEGVARFVRMLTEPPP